MADSQRSLLEQGQRHELAGEWEAAADCYRRWRELHPDDPMGPNREGVLAVALKQWDGAQARFQEALEIDPHFAPALANSGNLKLRVEDVQGAIALYQQAIAADPEYAPAYHNLAAAYKRAGRIDEMVRAIKQSQRLQRRAAATLRGVGRGRPGCATVLVLAAASVALWHH